MTTDVPADSSFQSKVPTKMILAVTGICVLPFVLNLFGVDFGSSHHGFDADSAATQSPLALTDSLHHALSGSFTHTILEWSAFCAAIFICMMAFVHYRITKDVTTPIIGVALLCAGCMDAFHTLAADRLIEARADNADLIPFTWAICRLFNALIMVGGLSYFVFRKKSRSASALKTIVGMSIALAILSYLVIHACAVSENLPRTTFPDSIVTRPWDVLPLIIFAIGGIFIYPRFHKQNPSIFSHALIISVIPDIATQSYMAFGSQALFDNNFNIGHFLKIVSYLVPLIGLSLDYIKTYQQERQSVLSLNAAKATLSLKTEELEKSNEELSKQNRELDEFSYVASHDLQEPLRKLVAFSGLLEKDLGDDLNETAARDLEFICDASARMQVLVNDLLDLSRANLEDADFEKLSLEKCADDALFALAQAIEESGAKIKRDPMPALLIDKRSITQLFQNLIGNALKFQEKGSTPEIHLTAVKQDDGWVIGVKDNGIGIDQAYTEQIFAPFKRLHGRTEYSGTGIGLAICRKAVSKHGGILWVDSVLGDGTHFQFTLNAVDSASIFETNSKKDLSRI